MFAIHVWIQNAAMLVLGFHAMQRASELANLKRKDLSKRDGFYFLQIRMSKTDKSHEGKEIAIEPPGDLVTCPV